MSVSWSAASFAPVLGGAEGELVSVRVLVEPRLLEDLLDALAKVPFPINPQIFHQPGPDTAVEFPAYSGRLDELRKTLARNGFDPAAMHTRPMLAQLSGLFRADAMRQIL